MGQLYRELLPRKSQNFHLGNEKDNKTLKEFFLSGDSFTKLPGDIKIDASQIKVMEFCHVYDTSFIARLVNVKVIQSVKLSSKIKPP